MLKLIQNARVTEKASVMQAQNVYTFDVLTTANKSEIMKAIFATYKVKPLRVNILKVPKKRVATRMGTGTRGGGKKALVYLKEGDKIEIK